MAPRASSEPIPAAHRISSVPPAERTTTSPRSSSPRQRTNSARAPLSTSSAAAVLASAASTSAAHVACGAPGAVVAASATIGRSSSRPIPSTPLGGKAEARLLRVAAAVASAVPPGGGVGSFSPPERLSTSCSACSAVPPLRTVGICVAA